MKAFLQPFNFHTLSHFNSCHARWDTFDPSVWPFLSSMVEDVSHRWCSRPVCMCTCVLLLRCECRLSGLRELIFFLKIQLEWIKNVLSWMFRSSFPKLHGWAVRLCVYLMCLLFTYTVCVLKTTGPSAPIKGWCVNTDMRRPVMTTHFRFCSAEYFSLLPLGIY